LRRIAQSAGVSHGAPRHHFPTYEALLAAIARQGLEDLDSALAPHFACRDSRQALTGLAQTYLEFARQRPEMFALITRHDLLAGAGGHLRAITGTWFARLVDLTEGDRVRAVALWSGLHGLAVLSRTRATEPLADTMPEPTEVAALLVQRLGTPAAELMRRSFE
jgi:AcrR family transcriptional regulator